MPPRYAYWTIIIDNAPTAFRAREREELLPTFRQLASRNPTATIKWFARGRLWESPEEARAATAPAPRERRGRDWRPGGRHEDPRARFKKGHNDGERRAERSQVRSSTGPGRGAGAERVEPRASQSRTGDTSRSSVGRPREAASNRPVHGQKGGPTREHGPRRRHKWDSRPTERPRGAGAGKQPFGAPDSRGEKRGPHGKGPHGSTPWGAPGKGGPRDGKWGDKRHGQGPRHEKKRKWERGSGPGTGAPTEPEPPVPPPPQPPGPDRPPQPGQEPRPGTPGGEAIKILPDPPERAGE